MGPRVSMRRQVWIAMAGHSRPDPVPPAVPLRSQNRALKNGTAAVLTAGGGDLMLRVARRPDRNPGGGERGTAASALRLHLPPILGRVRDPPSGPAFPFS